MDRRRRALLREVDIDFDFEFLPPDRAAGEPRPGSVAVRTWRRAREAFPLPLFGPHQAHNAAVAP